MLASHTAPAGRADPATYIQREEGGWKLAGFAVFAVILRLAMKSDEVQVARWLSYVTAFLEAANDPRLIRHGDGSVQIKDVAGASADLCQYAADGGDLEKFRLRAEKYMTPYNRS